MKVAFIGLGVMGYQMAGHLSRNGHDVRVFNRTLTKANKWQSDFQGKVSSTPGEACADGVEIAFLCVGDDPDVKDVVLRSDGVLSGLQAGAIVVDHTTTSAKFARDLAEKCEGLSIGFLDAPVSGGEAGAKNGSLAVMCGGDAKYFQKAKPIIESYAAYVRLIGSSGSGQLAKMVNQICIAGVIQGLSEGLNFGRRMGLNMPNVIDVVSRGAAQSWQMENRAKTMLNDEFDFGFAVNWMLKDLRICLDQAKGEGIPLPTTEVIRSFYKEIEGHGGGRWDTSSLIVKLKNGWS